MERLYLDALTGDEDAQLDFIRFIVTETDIPLPDVAVGRLTALAEKGIDQARRCYFSWALPGGAGAFLLQCADRAQLTSDLRTMSLRVVETN